VEFHLVTISPGGMTKLFEWFLQTCKNLSRYTSDKRIIDAVFLILTRMSANITDDLRKLVLSRLLMCDKQ
jgi:hypothetical protein